jgi:hypothetical protein
VGRKFLRSPCLLRRNSARALLLGDCDVAACLCRFLSGTRHRKYEATRSIDPRVPVVQLNSSDDRLLVDQAGFDAQRTFVGVTLSQPFAVAHTQMLRGFLAEDAHTLPRAPSFSSSKSDESSTTSMPNM